MGLLQFPLFLHRLLLQYLLRSLNLLTDYDLYMLLVVMTHLLLEMKDMPEAGL